MHEFKKLFNFLEASLVMMFQQKQVAKNKKTMKNPRKITFTFKKNTFIYTHV